MSVLQFRRGLFIPQEPEKVTGKIDRSHPIEPVGLVSPIPLNRKSFDQARYSGSEEGHKENAVKSAWPPIRKRLVAQRAAESPPALATERAGLQGIHYAPAAGTQTLSAAAISTFASVVEMRTRWSPSLFPGTA
jgi:hypothetical protein